MQDFEKILAVAVPYLINVLVSVCTIPVMVTLAVSSCRGLFSLELRSLSHQNSQCSCDHLSCVWPLLQNFVEPMVFGKRLNLHPVVVLFALVFWYMMWGIPGAFLSVPIVSVLKILCLNMDNMTAQWFARLLGAPPAGSSAARATG
jgi:hypothetical protein